MSEPVQNRWYCVICNNIMGTVDTREIAPECSECTSPNVVPKLVIVIKR